jgi:hypothetical protein
MSQKKEDSDKKPAVKVQDLAPKKDAKGGRAVSQNSASPNASANAGISQDRAASADRFSADSKSNN